MERRTDIGAPIASPAFLAEEFKIEQNNLVISQHLHSPPMLSKAPLPLPQYPNPTPLQLS